MEYRVNSGNMDAFIGSSLRGYLEAPYPEVVDRLGEPLHDDFDGKADAVWMVEFADGTFASVYNYKDGRNYLGEEGIPTEELSHWHIGGKSERAAKLIHWLFGRTGDE